MKKIVEAGPYVIECRVDRRSKVITLATVIVEKPPEQEIWPAWVQLRLDDDDRAYDEDAEMGVLEHKAEVIKRMVDEGMLDLWWDTLSTAPNCWEIY